MSKNFDGNLDRDKIEQYEELITSLYIRAWSRMYKIKKDNYFYTKENKSWSWAWPRRIK